MLVSTGLRGAVIAANRFEGNPTAVRVNGNAPTSNVKVVANRSVDNGQLFISFTGTDLRVDDNVVTGGGTAIVLVGSTTGAIVSGFAGNTAVSTLDDNVVSASAGFDCQDNSAGRNRGGVANVWAGINRGTRSSPAFLCRP